MKTLFIAFVIWSGGIAESYPVASERACITLTANLAPFVESANCWTVSDYASGGDYIPPAD